MQTPKEAPDEWRISIRERKKIRYRYFTRPGLTQEITHELSSSDRFGEFQHWFCMPPVKGWGSYQYFNWLWIHYSAKVTSASCSILRVFEVVGDVQAISIGIGSCILLLQTIMWHIYIWGTEVFLHIHWSSGGYERGIYFSSSDFNRVKSCE